jgi:hypothetical protein
VKRLVVACLVLAALVLGWAPPAGAEPAVSEAEFVARVNALRASKGLMPLAVDQQMTSVARAWSAEMAASGTLSHNPNFSQQITNWRLVGENVGTGPEVATIETAFENSPAHYANLVKPEYQFIGVGVVEVNGIIWVTQNFKQAKNATAVPATAPAPTPKPPPAPRPATAPRPAPAPKPVAAAAPVTVPPTTAPPVTAPAPASEAEVRGDSLSAPAAVGNTSTTHSEFPLALWALGFVLLLVVASAADRALKRRSRWRL